MKRWLIFALIFSVVLICSIKAMPQYTSSSKGFFDDSGEADVIIMLRDDYGIFKEQGFDPKMSSNKLEDKKK